MCLNCFEGVIVLKDMTNVCTICGRMFFFIYVSKMSERALKLFRDKQNVQQFKAGISKYDFKGMCHFLPVQNHVQFIFLQGTKNLFLYL